MDPREGKEDSLLKLQEIAFPEKLLQSQQNCYFLRNKKEMHAGSWECIEFRMADVKWRLQDKEQFFLCITLLNGAPGKYRWAQKNAS